VKVRQLLSLAAAAGLAIPAAVSAAEPAPLPLAASAANPNQVLADAVANRLRTADVTGAQINISTQDGVVKLAGTVRDVAQKDALIAAVRVIPGVAVVRDGLEPVASNVIQVGQPAAPVGPTPLPPQAGPVVEPAPLGVPGAVRVAHVRPAQQPQPRRVPSGVPVQRLPVHRAVLPVPEGAARLAEGHPRMERRPLVPRPHLGPARLLARQVPVIDGCEPGSRRPKAAGFLRFPDASRAGRSSVRRTWRAIGLRHGMKSGRRRDCPAVLPHHRTY